MVDHLGRAWFTTRIRPQENPTFCRSGSSHPSAQFFPLTGSGRQLSMYDPKTDKFTLIDTCFGTHHLMFAEDGGRSRSGMGHFLIEPRPGELPIGLLKGQKRFTGTTTGYQNEVTVDEGSSGVLPLNIAAFVLLD